MNKVLKISEIKVGILFIALILIFKVPFLNLPAFWDEDGSIVGSWAIFQNGLNPFVEYYAFRPPLVFMLGALSYKLFGYSLVMPRLIILFFAFSALWFTFLTGKRLYNDQAGFWASILLFFSPLFFAQSGLFLCAVPVTALAVAAIYFFIANKNLGYFISASLLISVKESGLLVIGAIASYAFIINTVNAIKAYKSQSFYCKIKEIFFRPLFLLSPVILFLIWIGLNKIFFGRFICPNIKYFVSSEFYNDDFIQDAKEIFKYAFGAHFRYLISAIITGACLFSLFMVKIQKKIFRKEFFLFLILVSITVLFFAMPTKNQGYAPLPRYYLFLHPLFFIFGTAVICQLAKNKIISATIFLAITGLFISCWYTSEMIWAGELNLNHRHIIKVNKRSVEYLERKFLNYPIITVWPISKQLVDPKMGYVKEPFSKVIKICENYYCSDLEKIIEFEKSAFLERTVIVVMPNLVQNKKARLLKIFKSGNEKVFIYAL